MDARFRRGPTVAVVLTVLLALPSVRPVSAADSADPPGTELEEAPAADDPYSIAVLPRKVRKVVFLSSAYAKRGEYQKAADVLLEHLQDHPDQDHYLVRLHLAQHLSDLGRTAEALDQYRHAVVLQPVLDRGWLGLGDAAYDLERFEVAGEAFLAGYECSRERRPEVLYYAAAAYLMADDPQNALPIFEQLTAPGRGRLDLKWYQGLVIAALGAGEPERAADGVTRLVQAMPDDPDAWFLQYQYAVGRRDFASAAIGLTIVGYLRDLTAAERRQLGDLYSANEVPWLAGREYAAALAAPDAVADAAAWERLVSSQVAAHDTDEALASLRTALAAVSSPRLIALQGDIHYLRREYADALQAYSRLATMGDDTGRAWLMQGYCALELGRREEALTMLGRASNYEQQAAMAQLLLQRALKLES